MTNMHVTSIPNPINMTEINHDCNPKPFIDFEILMTLRKKKMDEGSYCTHQHNTNNAKMIVHENTLHEKLLLSTNFSDKKNYYNDQFRYKFFLIIKIVSKLVILVNWFLN